MKTIILITLCLFIVILLVSFLKFRQLRKLNDKVREMEKDVLERADKILNDKD